MSGRFEGSDNGLDRSPRQLLARPRTSTLQWGSWSLTMPTLYRKEFFNMDIREGGK